MTTKSSVDDSTDTSPEQEELKQWLQNETSLRFTSKDWKKELCDGKIIGALFAKNQGSKQTPQNNDTKASPFLSGVFGFFSGVPKQQHSIQMLQKILQKNGIVYNWTFQEVTNGQKLNELVESLVIVRDYVLVSRLTENVQNFVRNESTAIDYSLVKDACASLRRMLVDESCWLVLQYSKAERRNKPYLLPLIISFPFLEKPTKSTLIQNCTRVLIKGSTEYPLPFYKVLLESITEDLERRSSSGQREPDIILHFLLLLQMRAVKSLEPNASTITVWSQVWSLGDFDAKLALDFWKEFASEAVAFGLEEMHLFYMLAKLRESHPSVVREIVELFEVQIPGIRSKLRNVVLKEFSSTINAQAPNFSRSFYQFIIEDIAGVLEKCKEQLKVVDEKSETKLPHHLAVIPRNQLQISGSPLGKGASAEVYKTKWQLKTFAFKQYHDAVVAADGIKEAKIAATLSSPHIIHIYGKTEDDSGILMEYMNKGSLHDLLFKQKVQLSLRQKREIAISICKAVQLMHERGIVHRDLKPGNIMVRGNEDNTEIYAKVGDFGTARALNTALTSGLFTGTIPFTAPELFEEFFRHAASYSSSSTTTTISPPPKVTAANPTKESDIYSLGILLYELSCSTTAYGTSAFASVFQFMHSVIQGNRPTIPASCPPEWQALFQKCWTKNAQERPTASEVVKILLMF